VGADPCICPPEPQAKSRFCFRESCQSAQQGLHEIGIKDVPESSMNYQDYFLEEMSALRELGKEFAQSQPRLAPFLATVSQDPDVERFLDEFAFLTAWLRQKLAADFSELSQTLLRVLWPHYLRPVPSFSMLEFIPFPVLSE